MVARLADMSGEAEARSARAWAQRMAEHAVGPAIQAVNEMVRAGLTNRALHGDPAAVGPALEHALAVQDCSIFHVLKERRIARTRNLYWLWAGTLGVAEPPAPLELLLLAQRFHFARRQCDVTMKPASLRYTVAALERYAQAIGDDVTRLWTTLFGMAAGMPVLLTQLQRMRFPKLPMCFATPEGLFLGKLVLQEARTSEADYRWRVTEREVMPLEPSSDYRHRIDQVAPLIYTFHVATFVAAAQLTPGQEKVRQALSAMARTAGSAVPQYGIGLLFESENHELYMAAEEIAAVRAFLDEYSQLIMGQDYYAAILEPGRELL